MLTARTGADACIGPSASVHSQEISSSLSPLMELLGMKLVHDGLHFGAETSANVEVFQQYAACAYKCWC